MNVVNFPQNPNSVVTRVSVQVSEYSRANGGSDQGTIYAVEVLFPDGKWDLVSHHENLADAWLAAGKEASDRKALLLPETLWPSRQITA